MAPGSGLETIESDHALTESRRIVGMATPVRTLSQTKVSPGQRPGHDVTLSRRIIVLHSLDPDFDGAQALEVDCSECLAGTGAPPRRNVNTHARATRRLSRIGDHEDRGDGAGTRADPPRGHLVVHGRDGQVLGITGQGTYRGQLTPAGPVCTFEGV
jgi:hypothetical protein